MHSALLRQSWRVVPKPLLCIDKTNVEHGPFYLFLSNVCTPIAGMEQMGYKLDIA
ncbi:hypothetical protein NXC12_CH02371 [Rhizobium etli]|uniref:Uncharacterized protein n=1 Tax=Rhizobium etli TaxID=29449 RepID=A0AAN1BFS0_RHIET|nr:hypothetical protein NXC12_CH02371 [Rhizobium etli]